MLFQHKHLLEELRETGRQATGEILDMTTIGESGSPRSGGGPRLGRRAACRRAARWRGDRRLAVDGFKDRAHIAKKGDTRAFIAPEGNHRELYQIPNSERQYFDVTFAPTVPVALRTVLTKHSAKGYLPPA